MRTRSSAKSSGPDPAMGLCTSSSLISSDPDEFQDALPTNVPSLVDIKRVIPTHCFKPTVARSFYYVFKDLSIIGALYLAMVTSESLMPPLLHHVLVSPIYWYVQGTMMWAIFVLGHDCGHGSFSSFGYVNDAAGNVLHALILVPYYPWKMSHQHHHKNTGNIDKDEIFYPVRERDYDKGGKRFIPLFGLGLSWFIYLWRGYAPRAAYHLNPTDPLFVEHSVKCSISLLCCFVWLTCVLLPYATAFGTLVLLRHYLIPLFVFATWLVITTFLHHQDEMVPWYSDKRWSYVAGQLSSVDRHYGWAHHLVHHIGTHQIHHLFSKIPHYHLEEATAAFRREFPHLVRVSNEPILAAFARRFQVFNDQQWIKDDTEIHVFTAKRMK